MSVIDALGPWEQVNDDPPGALTLVGILIGQADGEVVVTEELLRLSRSMQVERTYDFARNVYVFRIRPRAIDKAAADG